MVMLKQPIQEIWVSEFMEQDAMQVRKGKPGHLTSMKYELGLCTRRLSLCLRRSCSAEGFNRSTARVLE